MSTLDIAFTTLHPTWKPFLDKEGRFLNEALQKTFSKLDFPQHDFSVSCVLTSDDNIQELNRDYRGKDSPTNVLSFPMFDDFDSMPQIEDALELGDIILAYETIEREAEEQEKTLRDHVAHLFVHGFLHLCGYDHMTEEERHEMEDLEKEIMDELGLPDPYND